MKICQTPWCNNEAKNRYCSAECYNDYQIKVSKGEVDFQVNGNEAVASSDEIKTPEQIKVDLGLGDEWVEDQAEYKQWSAFCKDVDGNPSVTPISSSFLRLKKKYPLDINTLQLQFISDLSNHKFTYKKPNYSKSEKEQICLVVSIPDLHIGMQGWAEESGDDFDLKIVESKFLSALEELIQDTSHLNVKKIIFPVGSDCLHVDNANNTTTSGTPQDVDTRLQKIYRTARMMMVYGIDMCAQVAPVNVPIIPGNHDYTLSYMLGDSLYCWYRNVDFVHVDISANPRKYDHFGVNLFGFTHGNEEKVNNLPLIMADESDLLWSQCPIREFFVGHIHRKKQLSYLSVFEERKVRVNTLPSLVSEDEWHHKKGYSHRRCAEAFYYDFERGYRGHISTSNL